MKMQSIVIVLTILNIIKIIDSDSKHNDHDLFCLGEAPRGYVRICGWGIIVTKVSKCVSSVGAARRYLLIGRRKQ